MLITDTALTAFSDDFWAVMELVMQFALRLSVGDTPFGVCFWFMWSLFSCSGLAVRPFGGRFRHAEESLCFQRFPTVSACPGCVESDCAVGLSLAAQHGGLAPGDWGGLLVWWWFENSRAYLYYFFIVNDCQSVLRPARVWRVGAGRPVKRDGVFADSPFS